MPSQQPDGDRAHFGNGRLVRYALLENQVRLDVIAAGYDPLGGFLHKGRRGAPAMVLDLMEPQRPVVDGAVLKFALAETFSGADFILRSDGVVRLNPQLARRVAQVVSASVPITGAALPLKIIGAEFGAAAMSSAANSEGDSMAPVVVASARGLARTHRQHWLAAVERLNLRFFVHA